MRCLSLKSTDFGVDPKSLNKKVSPLKIEVERFTHWLLSLALFMPPSPAIKKNVSTP